MQDVSRIFGFWYLLFKKQIFITIKNVWMFATAFPKMINWNDNNINLFLFSV